MTDVGKDGEQDTMIFSELRVTKGLSCPKDAVSARGFCVG